MNCSESSCIAEILPGSLLESFNSVGKEMGQMSFKSSGTDSVKRLSDEVHVLNQPFESCDDVEESDLRCSRANW
jgi:hypothetical protein